MSANDDIVVLFVDDEPAALRSLRRMLIRSPFACLFEECGQLALETLARQRVDILVADLRMPEMDGIQLLQMVRERHPDVIRLVLSATSDRDIMLAAINKGEIFRFLTKPLESPAALRDAIDQAMAQVRLVRRSREADRLKAEFLASITHELKSPLASIRGFACTLLKNPDMDVATRTEFLGHVVAECERLTQLVTAVLDMSRIDAGNFTLAMEVMDLGLALEETAESMRHYFDSQDVAMSMRILAGNARVYGNRARLIQVFRNLLDNAVKYTPAGGKVEVSLVEEEGSLVARISDSGLGIEAKDLNHVCERFYRGTSDGARTGGAGLGLTIVKEILDRHEWILDIQSERGNGTSVSITVPCHARKKKPTRAPQ